MRCVNPTKYIYLIALGELFRENLKGKNNPFVKNSALDESIGLIRPTARRYPPPPAVSCAVVILISLSRRLTVSSTHQTLGRRASASVFRDVGYCRQARRRLPFGFGQVVGQDDSGATLNSHK